MSNSYLQRKREIQAEIREQWPEYKPDTNLEGQLLRLFHIHALHQLREEYSDDTGSDYNESVEDCPIYQRERDRLVKLHAICSALVRLQTLKLDDLKNRAFDLANDIAHIR